MVRLRVINVHIKKSAEGKFSCQREQRQARLTMPSAAENARSEIIARKVADKGNRQQRGCSLSRKWSHTRSRCKCRTHVAISVALPDNGRRLQAKSAAIAVQASSGQHKTAETSKWRARKCRVAAFLPRCIFNLTMKELLH